MMKKVFIIGGNAAGMSAASQVKRQQPDWAVTVFEKGHHISYAACGIPYYVQGIVPQIEDLITVTPDEAINKRNLDIQLKHEVTAIDPEKKQLAVNTEYGLFNEKFDYLLIATGARPMKAGINYTPSERIYNAHTLNDADTLFNYIETAAPKKCAVIGGGYIAIEMVEAFIERGLETHIIHRRSELSRSFEKELSDITFSEMEKHGVMMHLDFPVTAISDRGDKAVVFSGSSSVDFDLVVIGVGVEPNSELAGSCGIEIGVEGSIRVNEYMQTNYPYIYAAGDCAETRNLITGKPVYVPLALKANKEGVAAGVNISGGREKYPGIIGSAITKFCNLGLARTGLTLDEALDGGFDAFKFEVSSHSKAGYYPGSGKVTTILIAEKKTGSLLGAQLAGPEDSVKRIDVYVTAITAGMTLDQIFQLDLSYAPPFSPVYDPVVLAARVGRKKAGGK